MKVFMRKVKSAVTMDLPPPQTTINNPGVPWGTIIFSIGASTIIFLFLSWQAMIFLLDRAGAYQPDKVLASGLLNTGRWLLVLLIIIGISIVFGRFIVNEALGFLRYRLDTQLEIHKLRAQAAQQLPPTTSNRMTSEQKRKYRTIIMVMERAFQMIDETGKLQTRTEPWSRRSVGRLQLYNEDTPIGENTNLATEIKPWLLEKGILLSDSQMNIEEFPSLAAIQTILTDEFGPTINFRNGKGSMSGQYIGKDGLQLWA